MDDHIHIGGQLVGQGLNADLTNLVQIHSGPRHRLYRGGEADGIVLKLSAVEKADARATDSLRNEYELLRKLNCPGIVKVLGLVETASGAALAMRDAGEGNLEKRLRAGSLSITEFLDSAVSLAETVAHLHDARITHRDIHPGNIVWNSKDGVPTLCDFAIARTSPTLAMVNATPLEGVLPYISPEQTGRTARLVDWRADLYSLGATFYAMLTGVPPFSEGDAVALAHAHIARLARPPHEMNPEVPAALSAIVVKLLEKEPEQRYQSAIALVNDLQEAMRQWRATGTIEPFAVASHEIPRGLSIPDRLYGRDAELQSLADAFARTRTGGRELVLVTGGPGIGKSALVDRLRPRIAEGHGYYAAGKFDQLQRSVPFSGLAQALRSLVRQLLTESEASLARWRERIDAAVAPNGQLLVAIVPELERVLGPQPPIVEVGPVEARNRFQLVLARFLRVFAQAEHPFVLFLDDLQWVDAASLQLLEQWVSDAASHHLLVIGAFRDNEVAPSHSLSISLAGLRDGGAEVREIHLEPLGPHAVAQLAAATFGGDTGRMQLLAQLIVRKSAGNPFFVRRLLHLMHAQGLFRFDTDSRAWMWNESELEQAPISNNVLELMVLAIGLLPRQTTRLLEIAACIGHRFELGTVAELADLSLPAASEQLRPAIEDGLLQSHAGEGSHHATLQFAHDRVQQAAYGLLNEESRQALHHAIGRRMLERAGDDLDKVLFEIVDQFDLGEAHIAEAERHTLIQLNIAAGSKAKASAAYRASYEYLTVAKRHLGPRAWDEQPELTFTIHRELAESAYLAGEHAAAEELVEIALEHVTTAAAKADLYGLRVLAATVVSDWQRALHWGREGLSVFGLEWPAEGLSDAIGAEAAAVLENLRARKIEDLADQNDVQDADIRAGMRLLSLLGAPAYFSGSEVLTFLVARGVNLSLKHGPSPYSAFAFVLFGGIHNALTGQYDVGYALGKLALAMARRFGNRAEECRTLEVYGVLVHFWKADLRESLPLLKEGHRAGVESGELAFAAFSLNAFLINALPAGMPLTELLEEAEVALDFAKTQQNKTSVEITVPFRQIARALTGSTASPSTFDDSEFVESQFLEEARSHQTALGHYWVAKLQVAFLMGDLDGAMEASREAAKRVPAGILGMVTSAEHVFYTALALAAGATDGDVSSTLAELRTLHAKMATWAGHCPQNFAHKSSLIGAEIARLEQKAGEASRLYRAAIDHAEQQRFIQDEALAHELRARFLLTQREPAFAAVHLRLARERYLRWGAAVKVAALDGEFPESLIPESPTTRQGSSIDQLALIKASQAISVATTPERLFGQILRVVVEVAGAQRGILALTDDVAIRVHARIEVAEQVEPVIAEEPLEQCSDVPSAVFRYVHRTKEFLILSDAKDTGLFARDPVVHHRKIRSVLCFPLIRQSTVVGLIYLENNALANAFADELVQVAQVLAAQAVISLENSKLLEKLQRLTATLEERVSERTRQLTDQMTARDKAESALRATESRRALLLKLSDAIRALSDPHEIRQTAMRLFGEHLGLARAFYFDYQKDPGGGGIYVLEPGYHSDPSLPQLAGRYALKDFGEELFEGFERGEVIAVDDVDNHPAVSDQLRASYRAVGVQSFVNVPLMRDGKFTAGIGAADTKARRWVQDDFELMREVAARTWAASERARAEQGLREADRQKDEFLAMLAHELRNPLASISNAGELLARTVPTSPRTDAPLALLKRQTKQLTRLVDDLLDLSRLARGLITLEKTPLPLGELLEQAVETVQALIREKAHRFVMAKPPYAIYVRGDRARLVQSISNVIHNAVKYTDPGGDIRVEVFDSATEVHIKVQDNGTGISPELMPHLFDLFVQSARTLDRSQGGLGIGLSVVKRLMEMHEGSVQAESEGVGHGSTFTLCLPRIPKPEAERSMVSSKSTMRRRILIVDDNADAADSLAMLLKLDGHEVQAVYGAVEALEEARRLEPDTIFLDIGLPVMDGYEVARHLRGRMGDRPMRLIALTGYGQAEDRQRSLAAGFNDHLVKPVTPEALETLLSS